MSKMIAVTMGDPAGIGPEIIIKSLAEGALSGAPVVVVGCAQTLRRILALNITPRAELRIIDHPAEASFSPATINVIDEPLSDPQGLRPGEVQAQAGDLAFRCIRRATALALEGAVAAIATAPLNKEALHLAGHAYPGHTEPAQATRRPQTSIQSESAQWHCAARREITRPKGGKLPKQKPCSPRNLW